MLLHRPSLHVPYWRYWFRVISAMLMLSTPSIHIWAQASDSNIVVMPTSAATPLNPTSPPIVNGERLSDWLLKEKQPSANPFQRMINTGDGQTPYALGTTWSVPSEIATQEQEKQALLAALQKMHFPENDKYAQQAKKNFTQLIERFQATGRVALPNSNPRYLQANPKLDPILTPQDQVTVPNTPSTITVIRSNGTLCKVRYRPGIETRFFVEACRLKGPLADHDPDWAWVVEPNASVHKVSVATWNGEVQSFPAPGSWVWAPPRWSQWTRSAGEAFTKDLVSVLAAQDPSGLEDGIDQEWSKRASLPSIEPSKLYSTTRDLPISANIWGETGLMQTPSARTAPAGTGAITAGWFQPYTNVNLFFAPINGVEFILRYTNINNVPYGSQELSGGQTYKDKSNGLKVRLLQENAYLPELAVGVRDLLGTGLFSGEYFVASKRHNNFDFSAGMGWGQLGTRNNITNPFVTAFGQNYATRPAVNYNQGGTSTGGFFHGTAAVFGGVQYHTPWDKVVLKAELDGNNYQQLPFGQTLTNNSIFNFGATYQMKNADLTLGVLGNNQVMLTLSLHERLDLLSTPKLAEAKSVPVQLKNVGNYFPTNPSLQLVTASIASGSNKPAESSANSGIINKSVTVNSRDTQAVSSISSQPSVMNPATASVMTTQYNATLTDFELQTQWKVKGLRGSSHTWSVHLINSSGTFIRSRLNRGIAVLHRDAPSNIQTFQIKMYNFGMLVSEFSVDRTQWMLSETQLLPPSERLPAITVDGVDKNSYSFANILGFGGNSTSTNTSTNTNTAALDQEQVLMRDVLPRKPYSFDMGVSYAQVVGSPSSPFLFALGVKGTGEYYFRENTWLTSTVNLRVVDNFGKFNYDPPPTGLQPVRTDIRQYMTQSLATMPNMQLTNANQLSKNHFLSGYAGYLEAMFAGVGGEYLWRPTNSPIAFGADINRVRQRQFNMWTSMQNYNVTTGHATAYWDTGIQDILVKFSYGKYLAGDIGGTLDLSRVFANGIKIGAYATRTNVDYAQFGEGSFDKGVYLAIPFDAFFARHSDSTANLIFTPLIRDGGAMLNRKYRLFDMTRTRDGRVLNTGPD